MPSVDDILAATAPVPAATASATDTSNNGLVSLLATPGVMQQLAGQMEGGEKLTTAKVASTLQSLLNLQGSKEITKADFTKAMTALGAQESDATALWSLLSPYGLTRIDGTVSQNKALTSAIDDLLPTIQDQETEYAATPEAAAAKTMSSLLLSSSVIEALAAQSSAYVPPSDTQVISTLWSLFNTNGNSTIDKSELERALTGQGGKASDADALWKQLAPDGAPSINISQFISNEFVLQSLSANTPIIDAFTDLTRSSATAAKSNTLLDKFTSGGTGVLGVAAGNSYSKLFT